ncbi:hypothetical protein WG66_014319 [Moniliophthora roreri]|nr:hypothetical protein WG66_014319 [Moniliophthora roreri]
MAPTHSFSPSVWLFRHLKVKFHGSRYDEYRCDPAVEYGIGETQTTVPNHFQHTAHSKSPGHVVRVTLLASVRAEGCWSWAEGLESGQRVLATLVGKVGVWDSETRSFGIKKGARDKSSRDGLVVNETNECLSTFTRQQCRNTIFVVDMICKSSHENPLLEIMAFLIIPRAWFPRFLKE